MTRAPRHDALVIVFLQTPRLTLRTFTMDDVDDVLALDNDPAVMHHINGGVPATREHVVDVTMPRLMHRDPRWPQLGKWAIDERSTGDFAGWCGLSPHRRLDPPRAAVLGYRLAKAMWGRGYATEVSRALLDKGFADLDVELVTADTLAVNTASRRVMDKLGMTLARRFHTPWQGPAPQIEGFELGEVEYEITKEEWLRQRG